MGKFFTEVLVGTEQRTSVVCSEKKNHKANTFP